MSGRYTKAEALGEEMFRRRAGRAKVRSVKNKNGTTSRSGCGDKWSCGEIFCPRLLRRAFAQPFPDRFLGDRYHLCSAQPREWCVCVPCRICAGKRCWPV